MEKSTKNESEGATTPPPTTATTSGLTKAYLLCYNLISLIAWCVIFVQGSRYLFQHGTHKGMYEQTSFLLKLTQTFQILEIFHAALGMVRSSVFANVNQILGRNFVMWLYLDTIVMSDGSTSSDTLGYPFLLFGWSVSEVVRYLFYVVNLLDVDCFCLTWCRYTFFTFLYPIGGGGEITVIRASLPLLDKDGRRYSLKLPNHLNLSFNFYYFTLLVLCMAVPSIMWSYRRMLRQRAKVLGTRNKKDD